MTERSALGWKGKAAVTAGGALLRALATTWRYSVRNEQALLALRARSQPFVFALWHGQLLPLTWWHRDERVRVLVSEHRDGEIIARVLHLLGFETIRGSTTRGGQRALLALSRALDVGEEIAVTPDGPRGPARVCQPGAVVAAARSRAPILPIAAHASRAWRLDSWDGFVVPKPFARVTVAYGEPLEIVADSARAAAAETPRLERAMKETEARAARA